MRSFARVGVLTSLLVSVVLIVPIHVSMVSAESYTIELGETFYYDSCWTNVGNSARLERKVPGKTTWNQVARSKPVRSSECDSGSKLVSYKWKPKSVGKHRLRESLSYVSGSKRTYAKSFTLTIVEPSSDTSPPVTIATIPPATIPPATIAPATIATLPPSSGIGGGGFTGSGSNLLGCYLKGKKLWGKVYFTNYSFDADLKVYFTNYSFDANLKVWNAPNSFSASGCGQWYVTKYSFEADFKVYVTNYSFDADLKIYTTKYQFDAGLP
jgi:hypothetical protein